MVFCDDGDRFGEPVKDRHDAIGVPNVAAAPVRPALPEALRIKPNHLEQFAAVRVAIRVGGDLAPAFLS